MQNLGFWIINDIIWHKTNPVPNFTGSRLCNAHEIKAPNGVSVVQLAEIYEWFSKVGSQVLASNTVWFIPLCTGSERLKNQEGNKLHPTQKPEQLLEKLILMATKPHDLILDPFFGTGTTMAVDQSKANQQQGIETMQALIKAAQRRIEQITISQDAMAYLELEKKPPKVSMKVLIDTGYLKIGDKLYSPDYQEKCQVLADGKVCDASGQVLSIHKMSAKILNKINHKWFAGLFAGIAGAGNYYYLDMKETPLARTRGYNVLFNWGLRFQRSHNIFKIGVKNPLITRNLSMQANNTKVILNKTAKSANIVWKFHRSAYEKSYCDRIAL
ncbi:hypothetical protein HSHS1_09980 [Helicobacter suis HS1]|nr:hypothetical protein HSHS1_09980 [Helicobacter suis HS1]